MAIRVKLRSNEKIERALRRFKRSCEKEDLFRDILKQSHFEKPCVKRQRQLRKLEKEKAKRKREEEHNRRFSI